MFNHSQGKLPASVETLPEADGENLWIGWLSGVRITDATGRSTMPATFDSAFPGSPIAWLVGTMPTPPGGSAWTKSKLLRGWDFNRWEHQRAIKEPTRSSSISIHSSGIFRFRKLLGPKAAQQLQLLHEPRPATEHPRDWNLLLKTHCSVGHRFFEAH